MSDYNPLNILKQTPEKVKTFILAVLTALVVTGVVTLNGEQVAAWGLVIERGLDLMYVAPAKQAKLTKDLEELNA